MAKIRLTIAIAIATTTKTARTIVVPLKPSLGWVVAAGEGFGMGVAMGSGVCVVGW